jgi:cyclase
MHCTISTKAQMQLLQHALIFDTFTTVGAAKELKIAAKQLTGRMPSFVINSHAHADHYQGNVAFSDDAILIASTKTRNAMQEEGISRLERMKNLMMEQGNGLRIKLQRTNDITEKIQIEALLKEYDEFFAEYPQPEDLRLPIMTFEKSLSFRGSQRKAELIALGGAHSPCDAVLWLPDDEILFTADLIIPNDNLILTQGNPENWLSILEELEALRAKIIVPGHGGVIPANEGFKWARYYLNYIDNTVNHFHSSHTVMNVEDLEAPSGCRKYWFIQNVRFLLDKSQANK